MLTGLVLVLTGFHHYDAGYGPRGLDSPSESGRSDAMPLAMLGALGIGQVWGALCATVDLRRRPALGVAWLVASTAAVAESTALITRRPGLAVWAATAAIAGWLLRRTAESLVERQSWK